MTEAEVSGNFGAALEKVRQGMEVIVEDEHRPIAVLRAPQSPGRPIMECIAIAKAFEGKLGYGPIPDPDFARDVEGGIEERRGPLDVSAWD